MLTMRIFKYKDFVNERLGVAEETLSYSDMVLDIVFDEFSNFTSSEEKTFEKRVVLSKDKLESLITTDFPISEIKLDISFSKLDNDAFTKRFAVISSRGKHFTTNGLCYGIGEEGGSEELEDGTIMLVMGAGGIINEDKFTDIELMKVELESAITHELNHAFEGYARHKGNVKGLETSLTFALDVNVADVPESVWNIWWKELGYYIYWTENFELNAMIQDAFPYANKYTFEEMKSKTPSWDFQKRMFDWDPSDFKSRLIAEIKKTMPDSDPLEVLNNIKNGLADNLENAMKESGESSSIDPKLIRRPLDEFLQYCNKRIKAGAERLKRGIIRHYSR